jgi:uncharacterized protein YyaL (SSP411 family)
MLSTNSWAVLWVYGLITVLCATSACGQLPPQQNHQSPPKSNALIHETSPYLLQHAYNPVQWHAWNEATLALAQQQNKPLLISIGYAACHWCHVMEQESFEDEEVAQLMNEHFICIKVDREERPDVDQVYMTACQLINKSGGWPLNALALPTGEPFYAGTYYPKEDWKKILHHFIQLQQNKPEQLESAAQQLTKGIVQMHQVPSSGQLPLTPTTEQLQALFAQQKNKIDWKKGGFLRGQNKFPLPSNWRYLLRHGVLLQEPKAVEAVHTTLEQMALGGIYDQLGGGFARYSTDADWRVPHFEKMLYDNAQLVRLYAEAYQHQKNPLYKKVIEETLAWIEREMTAPQGGFYASLDADSEGEEGAYYVWTKTEIEAVLGTEQAVLFNNFYQITTQGNWEHHKNILLPSTPNLEQHQAMADMRQQLLQIRQQRERPALDNKQITAWNALQITAYVKAYRALGKEAYLTTAKTQMELILKQAWPTQQQVKRIFSKGASKNLAGFLDDYAFLIEACLELYQVTFEEQWLEHAQSLVQYTQTHFLDKNTNLFFYTPNYNAPLVAPKTEVHDHVIPASNSQMALNLYHLGIYYNNKAYKEQAQEMLGHISQPLFKDSGYFSNWGLLLLEQTLPLYEVAIVGKEAQQKRQAFDSHYLPQVLWLGGQAEGNLVLLQDKLIPAQTTIYVCQNRVCQRPVTKVAEALPLIQQSLNQ